jgi:hypothetical protein
MADPFLPMLTPQTVGTAQTDKLQAFGTATAVVAGVTAVNYLFNAPGGSFVQLPLKTLLTGVSVKPTDAGRASVMFPKASVIAALLPSPVGYVPPEYYGLHPEFWQQSIGRPIGSKPLGFTVDQERKDVFAAQQAVDALAAKAFGNSTGPSQYSPRGHLIPAGPINVTLAELAYLQSLPPGVASVQPLLLQQLESRRADLRPNRVVPPMTTFPEFAAVPGTLSPLPAVPAGTAMVALRGAQGQILEDEFGNPILVPTGSAPPLTVHQVDDVGARNGRGAKGINRELVHERADP